MPPPVILLLEPLHPDARAALDAAATVIALEHPDAPLADPDAQRVDAVVTRGRGQVTDGLMGRCTRLRLVTRAGVGLDNVDRRAASRRSIAVMNVPDALTGTVAEHTLALALAARREVVSSATQAREGRWEERAHYTGESVAGARVAVIGLGAIGRRTATLFRALGAEVVSWNRSPKEDPVFEPSLERAVDGADIVTLHVALAPETRGLMDTALLERLARGATVVNTARPAVVDRDAMLAALESGRVAAYAVDGFDPEPPPVGDALLTHPRVLVTPHVAALTQATFQGLCLAAVEGTLAFLDDRAPSAGAQIVRP